MFLISKEEVLAVIKRINNYLNECLWMDFEFCMINDFNVVMVGKISQSYNQSEIEIHFEQPHFVSSLFEWTSDASKPFIQLCTEEEGAELNTKYKVVYGNYHFKISAEDFETPPIIVIAKKITCVILNDNPFPARK